MSLIDYARGNSSASEWGRENIWMPENGLANRLSTQSADRIGWLAAAAAAPAPAPAPAWVSVCDGNVRARPIATPLDQLLGRNRAVMIELWYIEAIEKARNPCSIVQSAFCSKYNQTLIKYSNYDVQVEHLCQRDTINPFSDTFDVRFIPHWRNLIKSDLTFDGFDDHIFKLNRTAIIIKIIIIISVRSTDGDCLISIVRLAIDLWPSGSITGSWFALN